MGRSKEININSLSISEEGYLIGLFVGDGSFCVDEKSRHYKVAFSLNPKKDRDIQSFLTKLLRRISLNPFTVWANGCIDVRVNSKRFVTLLQKKLKEINLSLKKHDFFVGFLSGLIDSDGYVGKGDITISMKNPDILRRVQEVAKRFHIKSRLRSQTQIKFSDSKIWRLHISTDFKDTNHLSKEIRKLYQ